jgi:hypothetical protein
MNSLNIYLYMHWHDRGSNPQIYHTGGEHANYKTTDAVLTLWYFQTFFRVELQASMFYWRYVVSMISM